MPGLSLETIPPIHIPLRFFYSAPWMGCIAALVLLCGPGGGFSSRWSPELLAVTHLLTLGFMAMVMLGAMFQLVPVISGRLIPGGTVTATLVHVLLSGGTLLLAAGFQFQTYSLLAWAVPVLLLAFLVFLLALGSLLLRRIGGGDAIFSIRLAALALLLTVGLGLWRASNYAGLAVPPAMADAASIHLAWGLAGWALLLVMGAGYQVIPMFHVTPSYPTWLARAMPLTVFMSLLVVTLTESPPERAMAMLCLAATAIVYATYTIGLLNRRKRKIPDVTARFWRLSLGSLIMAALSLVGLIGAQHSEFVARLPQSAAVLIGVLMVYGFAISVIMGMLQKIVPFLEFLHLQRASMGNFELLRTLPHMGQLIPESRTRWQFRLHSTALLALLLAAANSAIFTIPAALLMLADFTWLGITLTRALQLYRTTALRVERASAE